MAGSLGSLVVSLALDAAEFTTGLTKSEYEAKKFAQKMDRAIADGAKAAAGAMVALGAAAVGAFAAIDQLAKQAGNFQDLAEMTGTNAEQLASFAVSAEVAGVNMETLAGGMNKLTKGLVTVEDETKDAGAALGALGINIKDFKQLDPATQMEEVAKALAGFEDGASKTAVAMALFGKSGAALLPFLKELAAEGGRQVILTQQQIERADAYADAQTRARATLQQYLQALATEALPTITSTINAAKTFIAALVGVSTSTKELDGEKIRQFAETGLIWLARLVDVADGAGRVFRILGQAVGAGFAAAEAALSGDVAGVKGILADFKVQREKILQETLMSRTLQAQYDADRKQRELAAREDRGFKPPGKKLSFSGKEDGKGAKAAQLTEAEQYLKTLDRQVESAQELSAVEQARIAIAKGLKGITPELERQIMLYAEMVDFLKKTKEEEKQRQQIEADAARSREEQSKAMTKAVEGTDRETKAIRDGNQQMEDQIVFLTQGAEAVNKLTLARLDDQIALKKDQAFALMNIAGTERMVAAINEQIAAMEKRKQLFADTKIAEQIAKEAAQLQDLKDTMSNALVDPLLEFVNQTKSAKDAFKSFIKSIEQILQRKAAVSIADWLTGGKTQSGFDLGTIFKLLSGLFGGGGAAGGIGYLPPGAMGPPMLAAGTSFHPGGRAWVGEQGPELVSLPRGAQVMPNRMAKHIGGQTMVFNVNVLPGADTRSARQAGETLRDVVVRSIKDR